MFKNIPRLFSTFYRWATLTKMWIKCFQGFLQHSDRRIVTPYQVCEMKQNYFKVYTCISAKTHTLFFFQILLRRNFLPTHEYGERLIVYGLEISRNRKTYRQETKVLSHHSYNPVYPQPPIVK